MVGIVANQLDEQCMKNVCLENASSVFINFIKYKFIIFFLLYYSLLVITKNVVKRIPFMLLNFDSLLVQWGTDITAIREMSSVPKSELFPLPFALIQNSSNLSK